MNQYADCADQTTLQLCESLLKRGTWKVWVKKPHGQGWLRQGFAWRTRVGAEQAALKAYPGANLVTSI